MNRLFLFLRGDTQQSTTRICAFICTLTVCIGSLIIIYRSSPENLHQDLMGAAYWAGAILGAVFLGKGVQKFAESERFNPMMYNRQTYFGEGNPFGEQP
jgi:hypothetical protein